MPRLEITITPLKGSPSKIEIRKNTPISSGSILNVPSGITIFLTSINGNIGEITGPNTTEFSASAISEEYRLIDGSESSNVLINVFKQLTGGVLASGPTNRIQARSRLTKFLLRFDGENLVIVLKKGKVDVNRRQQIDIKDENVFNSTKKRALFVRETTQLTLKDSIFPFDLDNLNIQSLTIDNEIKMFLNKQLKKQKKTLSKAGSFSKSAFKNLENGELIDEGIASFEKAIENGEISTDLIIQSSLLLADAYFRKDDLKRSMAWLDAGLHFSKNFYDTNNDKYEHFKNGKNKTAKAFGYDLFIANEYYAWAYDIKLSINGCLENANENPSKYRKDANELMIEIADY